MVRTSILRWTHKTICVWGTPPHHLRGVCVCGWVSCWCRGGHCNKWCMNGSCFETKWTHRTKQHLLTATQAWYFWYEGFQRHPLLWPTKNVTIPDHAGASMWDTSNTSNDIYIYILCYPPKTYLLLIFGVAHVLDILFLAAYIITWCRIIEGKYPFRCQKIHTYTYIYDYIYRYIYIYMIIYI